MNERQCQLLSEHFELGTPKRTFHRVTGGLLHIMWRLDTQKGSYAIKELSKNAIITDQTVVKNYEITEYIASRFIELGIPAISALEQLGKHLFIIDKSGFLVYPWVDGKSLDKDAISTPQALSISRILAKIHIMNIQIDELQEAEFDLHSTKEILVLEDLSRKLNLPFASELTNNLNILLILNKRYHVAVSTLKKTTVISHGDLDQKNVLWDDLQNPILIDWESARKLNPTYEIINAALDWSGITTQFNKDLFQSMIRTYKEAGGIIDKDNLEPALYGVLGNWLHWMIYNIRRTIEQKNQEDLNLGITQVVTVLPTILRLTNLIPELIRVNQS